MNARNRIIKAAATFGFELSSLTYKPGIWGWDAQFIYKRTKYHLYGDSCVEVIMSMQEIHQKVIQEMVWKSLISGNKANKPYRGTAKWRTARLRNQG